MNDSQFKKWLASGYVTRAGSHLTEAAQRDAVSRCRRVERYEGDLDEHYGRDQLRELISRFEYTTEDAARRTRPQHSVPITGDIRNGTASLRNALVLYRSFLESR